MFEINCSYCGKVLLREMRRINEGIMHGWKVYCSYDCQSKVKNKQKIFKCGNPNCNNIFARKLSEIPSSKICFCSQSCAAAVSNRSRALKRPKNYCANPKCKKIISRQNIYCSNKCQGELKKISPKEYKRKIIQRIRAFYLKTGRIPFKIEMWGIYISARRFFGTWNKAIIAAGFKPNPVRFAMKYFANDGHKCDSLAEKIIDDWLFIRNIQHEVKVPYGVKRMTADFKVNETYIEFFGLKGEVKRYDELVSVKERLWKEKKLKTVAIYPTDLFPKSRLDEILGIFQ